jgi:hypothetical protein
MLQRFQIFPGGTHHLNVQMNVTLSSPKVMSPYGTHKYTVWGECRVCTSQETHNVSTTKPNWLMLFGETVAVYCENHTEHSDTLCGQNVESVPHRKHIMSPLQTPTG